MPCAASSAKSRRRTPPPPAADSAKRRSASRSMRLRLVEEAIVVDAGEVQLLLSPLRLQARKVPSSSPAERTALAPASELVAMASSTRRSVPSSPARRISPTILLNRSPSNGGSEAAGELVDQRSVAGHRLRHDDVRARDARSLACRDAGARSTRAALAARAPARRSARTRVDLDAEEVVLDDQPRQRLAQLGEVRIVLAQRRARRRLDGGEASSCQASS